MNVSKILVPIDFSPVTEAAVATAADLARKYGASLLLLFVIDDGFPYPELHALDAPADDFYRGLRHRAEERMAGLVVAKCAGVAVDHEVTRGRPHQAIVDFARTHHFDLIVMSTHGTGGVMSALLGSVTDRVLRVSPCPVLVLRHGA